MLLFYTLGSVSCFLLLFLVSTEVIAAFSISTTNVNNNKTANLSSSLWTPVAIDAAKKFTVSQREKLADLGTLEKSFGPIRIIGEPIDNSTEKANDYDDDDKNCGDVICTKVLHFQRHGQGYHNLICDMWREEGKHIDFDSIDPKLNPVIRPELVDPPLTELGRKQCMAQRSGCSLLSPELVVVSPLLRCIQTAKLSFFDHSFEVSGVPWISHEGCREELGLLTGNKRRSISEIKADYPDIDFDPIQHDQDILWESYGEKRETLLEKSGRIYNFLTEFIMKRPEKEIAIISHSAYLFTLLNAVMDIGDDDLRCWFLTSEVKSVRVSFHYARQ